MLKSISVSKDHHQFLNFGSLAKAEKKRPIRKRKNAFMSRARLRNSGQSVGNGTQIIAHNVQLRIVQISYLRK